MGELPVVKFVMTGAQVRAVNRCFADPDLPFGDRCDLTDQVTVRAVLWEYSMRLDADELSRFGREADEIIALARERGIFASLARLGLPQEEIGELFKRALPD